MLLWIGIGALVVVVLIAGAACFVSTRPDDLHVERSAEVAASPAVVFAIVNDLSQWGRWSPYDGRDPDMKKTFEGPASGPDASYAWNGNDQVGEGRLTIVESVPNERVTMRLQFVRPFACDNQVNFVMTPSPNGTRITWIMDGRNGFLSKAMCLVMNMDAMVGKDFEQGLANLDSLARVEFATDDAAPPAADESDSRSPVTFEMR